MLPLSHQLRRHILLLQVLSYEWVTKIILFFSQPKQLTYVVGTQKKR